MTKATSVALWLLVVLTAAIAGALGFALYRHDIERRVDAAQREFERQRDAPRNMPVPNNCVADNQGVECEFSNTSSDRASGVCVTGKLVRKVGGSTLATLPICSGTLDPHQTKAARQYWRGGFAKDLCASQGRFGLELDWSVCAFSSE